MGSNGTAHLWHTVRPTDFDPLIQFVLKFWHGGHSQNSDLTLSTNW
jgi:hypothetical protein